MLAQIPPPSNSTLLTADTTFQLNFTDSIYWCRFVAQQKGYILSIPSVNTPIDSNKVLFYDIYSLNGNQLQLLKTITLNDSLYTSDTSFTKDSTYYLKLHRKLLVDGNFLISVYTITAKTLLNCDYPICDLIRNGDFEVLETGYSVYSPFNYSINHISQVCAWETIGDLTPQIIQSSPIPSDHQAEMWALLGWPSELIRQNINITSGDYELFFDYMVGNVNLRYFEFTLTPVLGGTPVPIYTANYIANGSVFNHVTHWAFNVSNTADYYLTITPYQCAPGQTDCYQGQSQLIIDNIKILHKQLSVSITPSSYIRHCYDIDPIQLITTTTYGTAPYSYNWAPITSNSANVTVAPNATTTYSVTVTDASGCSIGTASIIINFDNYNPSFNISVDPIYHCEQATGLNTTPFTVNGAQPTTNFNFAWTPSAGLSSTSSPNPIPNPNTSTSYTVMVTDAQNCVANATANYIILPAASSPISGNLSSCLPLSSYVPSVITAGYNYNWSVSPSAAATPNTGTGTSFNPAWNDNAFPTNAPAVITLTTDINGDCSETSTFDVWQCCSDNIHLNLADETISGSPIIYSSSNLTGTIHPLDDIVLINGIIVINTDVTFIHQSIRLGSMAKIIVQPGRTLTIERCSMASNCTDYMWDGIYVENSTANVIIIDGSTIRGALNAVVSRNCGQYHIDDATFDRNYIDMIVSDCSGSLNALVKNTSFDCSHSLIYPHNGERTLKGIDISNVADITIGVQGTQTLAYNTNTFSNMYVGIYNLNSNLNVYDNIFNDIKAYPTYIPNNTFPYGTAIYSLNNTSNSTQTTIGENSSAPYSHNVFTYCPIGIKIEKEQNVNIKNNLIENCSTGATIFHCMDLNPIIHIYGNEVSLTEFGFRVIEFMSSDLDIFHNQFNNVKNCIQLKNAFPSSIRYCRIQDNDIDYTNIDYAGYTNYGIDVWNVNGNTTNSDYCLQVYLNRIQYHFLPTTSAVKKFTGIRVYNCIAANIKDNSIEYTYSDDLTNTNCRHNIGIDFIQSPQSLICGNFIYNSGLGMQFTDNTVCNINNNEFHQCYYAVEYNNGNTGNQGSGGPMIVNNNYFENYSSQQIIWIHGKPSNSNLLWFYDNSSTTVYEYKITLPHIYTNPLVTGIAINPPVQIPECSIHGGIPPYGNPTVYLEGIANEETEYENDIDVFRYYEQRSFCNNINHHPELLDSLDETGLDYYNELKMEDVWDEENVYLMMDNRNYKTVVDSLGNINFDKDPLEVYYTLLNVTPIYVNSWAIENNVISSGDTTLLDGISKESIFTGGNSVAAACVMLDKDLPQPEEEQSLKPKLQKMKPDFTLYPNPAFESATIRYSVADENTELRIIDVTGRQIKSYNLNPKETLFTFDLSNLSEGIYFITIQQNGSILYNRKLTVIKK